MRWLRRRPKGPALTADQWLSGIQRVIGGSTVHHEHVIKHEPIPKPESASVVFKRLDGSDAWRGYIHCGPRYRTHLDIPLANIDKRFSPSESLRLEFEWER